MKVFVLAGIAQATIFSHVPLATALRSAGHQVIMTSSLEELIPTITENGLAAVRVTDPDLTPRQIIAKDERLMQIPSDPVERERQSGRWYGRLEEVTLDAVWAFGEQWRPDVVIGGTGAYAGSLLAARLGVPYVRQGWDIHDAGLVDLGAAEILQKQLAELGLVDFPEPDLTIDVTPPSLRVAGAAPAQMMRWIPGNSQCCLEPWMYTRGPGPRIGVTVGTGVANHDQYAFLQGIVENVGVLDVEVVVPVTEDAAPVLRERLPDVRIGWVPLDVLAPTCDVLVHQSGGSTMMTALSAGVPQVLIPDPHLRRATEMARRLAEAGAAIVLSPEEAVTEAVAKACQEVLTVPGYAAAAAGLGREIAALPLPSEVARRVEWLVRERPAPGIRP